MRTFLVTGGAGFIGSHIATALVERGDRVRVLDNLIAGSPDNLAHIQDDIDFIESDVSDSKTVAAAMKGVDCVFHQAALASVPLSVENPLATNAACVTGTVTLLDESRKAGVRRLVYASSSALYGEQGPAVKDETNLPAPISPYGVAKLAAEYYCSAFYETYKFETVSLRYFNVFGPRQDPDSPYSAVIPIFITALLEGRRPTIFGDGGQSRDFTYVSNVVHGNLLAADAPKAAGRAMNLANGRSITLLEMLAALNSALGANVEPIFADHRPGDIRESRADITRARKLLDYEPQVEFEAGVNLSIDYYRELVKSRSSAKS